MSDQILSMLVCPGPGDTVASLVRKGRGNLGISQEKLAEMIGEQQSLICLLERGGRPPRLRARWGAKGDDRYKKLAKALGLDVDAFVGLVCQEQERHCGATGGGSDALRAAEPPVPPAQHVRNVRGGLPTFMDTYEPGREGHCFSVGSAWWRTRFLIPPFPFELMPYPDRLPCNQRDRVLARRASLRDDYLRGHALLARIVAMNNAMSDLDARVAQNASAEIVELLGPPGAIVDVLTINRAYYRLAFRLAAIERSLAFMDASGSGLLACDLAVLADATAA